MTEIIDALHFQELSKRDPQDVCRKALCTYDSHHDCYELSVWGDEYAIFPNQFKISCADHLAHPYHEYFNLFIIHYLLEGKEIETSGEWISEKDIPGGTTFFRGPHEIPTNVITRRFNNNTDAFQKTCKQLHGTQLKMADAAYSFQITPPIQIAVLYWRGDDEFPAEAKILYDKTIADQLASDIIWALAVSVCHRLGTEGL